MTTYAELQAQKEAIEKELLKRKTEAFNEVVTTFAATCKAAGFALDEMAAALIRLHNRRQRDGTHQQQAAAEHPFDCSHSLYPFSSSAGRWPVCGPVYLIDSPATAGQIMKRDAYSPPFSPRCKPQ